MACGESLTYNFAPTCDAIKKPGGFANFGYIGSVDDLASVTASSGTITALGWDSTKVLTKFATKERVITAESPIEDEGVGNIVLVNHTINLPIYFSTQAELNGLQTLLQADRLFVILPTSNKLIRVYGLVNDPTNYDFENFGLKVTGGADAPGQNLNDASRINVTMTGQMPGILPCFFLDTDYSTSISTLEGYLTNP